MGRFVVQVVAKQSLRYVVVLVVVFIDNRRNKLTRIAKPSVPPFLARNQFMHTIDSATHVDAPNEVEFLKKNFFLRDRSSVPAGCVATSFDPSTMRVLVIINQDETIVRSKNYWGYNWTNDEQGVIFNKVTSTIL